MTESDDQNEKISELFPNLINLRCLFCANPSMNIHSKQLQTLHVHENVMEIDHHSFVNLKELKIVDWRQDNFAKIVDSIQNLHPLTTGGKTENIQSATIKALEKFGSLK